MDDSNGANADLDAAADSWTGRGALRAFVQVVHRFRWAVVVLVGFHSAAHLASAVQKDQDVLKTRTVVAEKYEVPGPNGKPAAMLYRSDAGQARLVFLDEKGGLRLFVGMNPDGAPGITMFDQTNKQKLNMVIDLKNNLPQIDLFDDQGNAPISLSITKELGPTFLIGAADKGRIAIGLSEEGEPRVVLCAKDTKPRISLELIHGAPVIRLFDRNNVVRARWRVLPDGSPVFSILDSRSRERLSMGTDNTEQPFIRLSDPDKNTSKAIR